MKRSPPARVLNTAARVAATIVATVLRDRLIFLGADPGSLPSEISARCLRASLATALLLVNVAPDVIRRIDWWRTDEMLQHFLGAIGRIRKKPSLRKIVKVWTEWDGDEESAGSDDNCALGKNDSCDATDCVLSDESVLTGDTSRKHWWRVAVDPPGWTPQNTSPLQAAAGQRSSNICEEGLKSTRHSSSLASQSLASTSVVSESVPFGFSVFRGSPTRGHRCGVDDTSSIWAADSDTSSIDYHVGDMNLVWPGSVKNGRSPRHTMIKKRNESASKTVEILKVLSKRCGDESSSTTSSSDGSDGSMPPPGFTLPLKEIRDTDNFVRKTLSKLALDHDMKSLDDNRVNFATFSVDASTNQGEILPNHSSPLNGLQFVYSVCGSGASNQIVEPIHRDNSKKSGGGNSSSATSNSSTTSSSDGSDGGMPPPGFTLPRKEIRDTIKYHHKLGKILSKLALDPDMKSMDDIGVNCAMLPVDASTKYDYTNHRELLSNDSSLPKGSQLFVNSVCGSGALKRIVEPVHTLSFEMRKEFSNGAAQWVSNFENVVNHDVELERVPSLGSASSSSNYSSKTCRSKKLEQHLSFLESHMIFQFSSSAANWPAGSPTSDCQGDWTSSITDCNHTSISNMPSNASFFPMMGDLRSPPKRTPSPVGQNAADAVPSLGSTACNSALPPLYSASPPITPFGIGFIDRLESIKISTSRQEVKSIDDDNDDDGFIHQQGLDNACRELVEDLRRIKDETTSMMKEIKNEIRYDIVETVDKQMQQHRSRLKFEVSELSERLESATHATIKAMQTHQTDKENESPQCSLCTKASSPFPRKQLQSPASLRHSTDSSTFFSKAPITPATENVINSEVLLKELQKSFVSMEARIFDKFTAHMDKDAIRQQHAIEEIIEEKVSKVIAGSNLEMKLAVQAVKAETERVSKMVMHDRTPPTDRTPPRSLSKNQTGFVSPIRQAPFPRNVRSSKSIGADKSWIRGISSSVIKDAEEAPQKSLEDSFTETMNAIDEFVADCDDLVSDFDKIASRMQDGNVSFDSD